MRRFVRDRVLAAVEQAKPRLEELIAEYLQYPEGFPNRFPRPVVMIRELRELKIVPLAKADLPPVKVDALIKGWLFARDSRVRDGRGPGVLDIKVQLIAHGTMNPDGSYNIEPRAAILKAWWRDMALTFSPTGK
jgi:hypothetical protein